MRFLFLLLFVISSPLFSSPRLEIKAPANAKKKVLLIGIDGLQYEKLNALNTPNFDAFRIVKAYCGGIVGTPSQQTTGSGPGWMTILTGVWNDQHGVISNDTSNKVKVKTVFQYLKEQNPKLKTTSIATWSPIHDFMDKQMNYVDKRFDGGTDEKATHHTLSELENSDPDFLFVHYSDPDVVGHNLGYGDKYDQSILTMDAYLGRIMEIVNKRSKEKNEEWLVILTTDHGRRGDGHHHGSQTVEEKIILIGMNVAGNAAFNKVTPNVPNTDFGGIYQHPAQTSILTTILTYFNIRIDPQWQLSSPSLLGSEGPVNLMINAKDGSLHWNSKAHGNASIYKDQHLLATVPAKQGQFRITGPMPNKRSIYTVMINGQSGSVTRERFRITAATNWNDDKRVLFLFNDNTYLFYDKQQNKAIGVRKKLSGDILPGCGEYLHKLEAIIQWNASPMTMFLNDGKYIQYSLKDHKIEKGYPKEITNTTWPGLEPYKNEIIAAVKMNDTKAYFFTRDGRYIVFNIQENRTETTYALSINEKTLPGLAPYASKISSAIDWSSDYFYILLKDETYLKYDKLNNRVLNDVPIPVNATTFPGLLN